MPSPVFFRAPARTSSIAAPSTNRRGGAANLANVTSTSTPHPQPLSPKRGEGSRTLKARCVLGRQSGVRRGRAPVGQIRCVTWPGRLAWSCKSFSGRDAQATPQLGSHGLIDHASFVGVGDGFFEADRPFAAVGFYLHVVGSDRDNLAFHISKDHLGPFTKLVQFPLG